MITVTVTVTVTMVTVTIMVTVTVTVTIWSQSQSWPRSFLWGLKAYLLNSERLRQSVKGSCFCMRVCEHMCFCVVCVCMCVSQKDTVTYVDIYICDCVLL